LTNEDKQALRKRVAAFVRARRGALGLSTFDLVHALGYQSTASVSCIENATENISAKRAYAWADVLEVPQDAFFQFVTGLRDTMDVAEGAPTTATELSAAEKELIAQYRTLPASLRRRLREQAGELEELARARQRKS
jgi:transcriptional regulator with XRE-family HTH domain